MNDTIACRQAVLAHVVAPFVEGLETPANAVDRVRASMMGMLQADLRSRREALGDDVFALPDAGGD